MTNAHIFVYSDNGKCIRFRPEMFPLYKATGAIPRTQQCPLLAATANVGMGSFVCTSDSNEIDRYCQNVCPVDPLKPVTDPDAIRMENGDDVILDKLSTDTQTALSCLRTEIAKSHGTLTVTSAYRSQAYQDHLYEIFDKRKKLSKILKKFPQCEEIFNNIDAENNRHKLKNKVGKNSKHGKGDAFDANWTVIGNEQVDAAAKTCLLVRPFPDDDPVHFQK